MYRFIYRNIHILIFTLFVCVIFLGIKTVRIENQLRLLQSNTPADTIAPIYNNVYKNNAPIKKIEKSKKDEQQQPSAMKISMTKTGVLQQKDYKYPHFQVKNGFPSRGETTPHCFSYFPFKGEITPQHFLRFPFKGKSSQSIFYASPLKGNLVTAILMIFLRREIIKNHFSNFPPAGEFIPHRFLCFPFKGILTISNL